MHAKKREAIGIRVRAKRGNGHSLKLVAGRKLDSEKTRAFEIFELLYRCENPANPLIFSLLLLFRLRLFELLAQTVNLGAKKHYGCKLSSPWVDFGAEKKCY